MNLSIKEFCERNKVGEGTALHLIHSRQLKAYNASRKPNGKPLWRIPEASEAEWQESRTAPPPAPAPTRRRRKTNSEVIEFFK